MSLFLGKDQKVRCPWCKGFEQYIRYHDEEWGVPTFDDQTQFEFLVLESAQAGLSWATILKKREAYRQAFSDFRPTVTATFEDSKVNELMDNSGIVRNRAKIEAAVNNARCFLEIQQKYGSFSRFIWDFVDGKQITNHWKTLQEVPATTPESDKLAKEMKRNGFRFLGSTTLYAHMQATGLVNDHLTGCFRHQEISSMERGLNS